MNEITLYTVTTADLEEVFDRINGRGKWQALSDEDREVLIDEGKKALGNLDWEESLEVVIARETEIAESKWALGGE